MSVISLMVDRLEMDVAPRGTVPNTPQYEQAVRDAVSDFSRRAPLHRIATLAMVSGQAVYDLPADFIKIICVASMASPDGLMNTPTGLVPVATNWQERWTVAGRKITFTPVPGYTMARTIEYAGAYVLSGSFDVREYADMTDEVEAMVMIKAQALVLMLQANDAAKLAWQYQIGDERVSKEKLAAELRAQAQARDAEYLARVDQFIGPVGLRG